MADSNYPPEKLPPETASLRAPQPRRLRRGAVIGAVAVIAGVSLLAFSLALLRGPKALVEASEAPVPADESRLPAFVRAGPLTYADLPPREEKVAEPTPPPALGPPMAGDLAHAGVPAPTPQFVQSFTAPAAATAPQAEELEQALSAGIFIDAPVDALGGGGQVRARDTTPAPGADGLLPAGRGGRAGVDSLVAQNLQAEKRGFLDGARARPEKHYVAAPLRRPVSPFEVKAGSVIPCTLITGINSDLPGQITCHTRQNVFDTVTGNHLLIPQGTRAIGQYDSVIAFAQERVLAVWHRLVMPNGNAIDLEGMPGVDLSGYAGYKDRVNHHWGRLITGVLLSSILSAAPVVAAGDIEGYRADVNQEIARNVGINVNQTGQRIVDKNLNIQPTIEIRPGYAINIFVQKDLILEPYQDVTTNGVSLVSGRPTD